MFQSLIGTVLRAVLLAGVGIAGFVSIPHRYGTTGGIEYGKSLRSTTFQSLIGTVLHLKEDNDMMKEYEFICFNPS